MSKSTQLFDNLEAFVREIGSTKQAADGDPPTAHPTGSADDGTVPISEGPLSKDVSSLVKEQNPASVDGQGGKATPAQPALQYGIGVEQVEAGDQPAAIDYKDHPIDPPTSTPIKADTGEKYSSWKLTDLVAQTEKKANAILATIAAGARPAPAAPPATKGSSPADLGYKAAAALGAPAKTDVDRAALTLADTIKEAKFAADMVATLLNKKAEEDEGGDDDEPSEPPTDDKPKDKPKDKPPGDEGGGGPPPGPGSGDGSPAMSLPGMDAGAAMGGPPPPAADPMAGMGGPPPGADPMAGMGGPLPGADPAGCPPGADPAGGIPGGQVHPQEAAHELVAAMIEMGISPQDLIAIAQKSASAEQRTMIERIGNQATEYRRSGRFELGAPKTARAKAIRGEMRNFLKEISA